jgi:hypothetical protein
MPSRRFVTTALLGGAAAMLAPAPTALANDRDLRGTTVPAAACVELVSIGLPTNPWRSMFHVEGSGAFLAVRCPLLVNNVELSGTSSDNDMSKFRVHYRDSDGRNFELDAPPLYKCNS